MRFRLTTSILIALALAASLAAQTKYSCTVQCAKADPVYTVSVGDRPDHVFSISKVKCTFPTPLEFVGVAAKEEEFTNFSDIGGSRARNRATGFGTLVNGDRWFFAAQSTSSVKEGAPQTLEGTWSFTGGTGKLKGIKGKGTVKGKVAPDGTSTFEVEGEYQLP